MPDSERPTGDDSREVERRPGDGSGSVERRARTSTADRPSRGARPRPADARSSDPRKDGVRTPPRRPKARPTAVVTGADDVDVAAALAAVPDAEDLATDDSVSSRSGRSAGRRNGAMDPLLVPVDESSVDESSLDESSTDAGTDTADIASTAGDDSDTGATEGGEVADDGDTAATAQTEIEAPTEHDDTHDDNHDDTVAELVETDSPADLAEEPVDEPAEEPVEDRLDDQNATMLLPQVEEPTDRVDTVEARDTEVIPRVYDVELDEPGAYAVLVPAVTEPAPVPAPYVPPTETVRAPVRRRRRPRVRRVTRVIRHVDTWTVFKVVALFNLVLYATTLIAGVLLWNVAHGTGTIDNVERFMESFGWETFEFKGQELFDNGWRIGLFIALGLTGLAVLAATTFNLITDIVGGIRVTVLEEEVVVAGPEVVAPAGATAEAPDSDDDGPG